MSTTLSVRIDIDTKKRLEALAKRSRRSKSFLAAEAIAAFVEAESWQLDEIRPASRSSTRAAVFHTKMWRSGFTRGVASVSERRLACDHRLVAASHRALAHLREYIARDNPNAGNRIASALLEAVERLAKLPNLGRPGRVAGTRELVVSGTPFIIPYRLRGDRLEIVAVFHARQKWPKQL